MMKNHSHQLPIFIYSFPNSNYTLQEETWKINVLVHQKTKVISSWYRPTGTLQFAVINITDYKSQISK
jgi:hypothetical protein